jgi:hypothetical protein
MKRFGAREIIFHLSFFIGHCVVSSSASGGRNEKFQMENGK